MWSHFLKNLVPLSILISFDNDKFGLVFNRSWRRTKNLLFPVCINYHSSKRHGWREELDFKGNVNKGLRCIFSYLKDFFVTFKISQGLQVQLHLLVVWYKIVYQTICCIHISHTSISFLVYPSSLSHWSPFPWPVEMLSTFFCPTISPWT